MRARWLPVALVPLGTILGHALGYAAAGQDFTLSGTHGHLLPALWPAAAATVVALASVALAGAAPGRRVVRTSWLLAAQAVAFALLEGVEHLHAGHHALAVVAEPGFRWGLGAQIVSAGLLVVASRLASATGALVRTRLARRPAPPTAARRRSWHHVGRRVPVAATASSVSERGPPRRPAAA